MVWEYYVQSRSADDYRQMLLDTLYHPPHIEIDLAKCTEGVLYFVHHFEGRPLVKEFIANTMVGIEYLWGGAVQLETSEIVPTSPSQLAQGPIAGFAIPLQEEKKETELKWQRVLYTMEDRTLSKEII
jgi:stage V sporulation protein R